MKYVSVQEMIAIEKEADSKGHTYSQMMEFAGRRLAEVIQDVYDHLRQKEVLGLVGSGNNGGDALVAFCYLQDWGWKTTAYIVRQRPENDPLVKRFLKAGGRLLNTADDPDFRELKSQLDASSLLVDAVLGTGIRLPLRGDIPDVLSLVGKQMQLMEHLLPVIAVDCPSGLDCDSGEVARECLPAAITVTMAAVKEGLLKFPAYNFVGDLRVVGIGLPEGLASYQGVKRNVVNANWVRKIIPPRPLDSHKGSFGTALIIGGAINYCGAVLLAGEAAFRSGSGWVTLAVPEPLHGILAGQFVEATWILLPHDDGYISVDAVESVRQHLVKPTTVLIGPGFGLKETSRDFIAQLLHIGQNLPPVVFDADGLKLLADIPEWWNLLPANSVLTPHPGEMSILTGLSKDKINQNRIGIAEKFAQKWGHVVVLKGAFTIVSAPDGRTGVVPVATPALARAGTGDVLAGLIAGFRSQAMDAFDAAVAAVWIHAEAGLLAAEVFGSSATVLAGDVLAAVVDVMAELE